MIPIVLGVFSAISVYMAISTSIEEYVSPDVKAASIIKAVIKRRVANDSYSKRIVAGRMLAGFIKRRIVEEDNKYSNFKYLVSLVCEGVNVIRRLVYPLLIIIHIIIFLWPVLKFIIQLIFLILTIKVKILLFVIRLAIM